MADEEEPIEPKKKILVMGVSGYIGGNVAVGETPICALVLANGQSMFSCRGDGRYDLDVPLDSQDRITLQVFAAGFEPVSEVLTPVAATEFRVEMGRAEDGRDFQVSWHAPFPATSQNRLRLRGTIQLDGTPICALALANGQKQFTCGDSLGEFDLDAPLDAQGNVTLQVFAAGFQPYRDIISPVPEAFNF